MIRVNQRHLWYFIPVFFLAFSKGFGLSTASKLYYAIVALSFLMILIKVLKDKWYKQEIREIVLVTGLIILNMVVSRDETLLFSLILLLGVKNIDVRSILKVVLWGRAISFVMVLLLVALGIKENTTVLFYRDGVFLLRQGYGFGHPNLFHTSYMMIVLLICFLYYRKLNLFWIGIILAINYYIYQLTFSRTSYYMVAVIVFIYFIYCYFPRLIQEILRITPYMQLGFLGLTYVLAVFFKTGMVQRIDRILTGRIRYANMTLAYLPNLLGKDFSKTNIIFDNSYFLLLAVNGLFITLLLMLAYIKISKTFYRKQQFPELILFFCMSIIFFVESYYCNALFNFTLFYMVSYWFSLSQERIETLKKSRG